MFAILMSRTLFVDIENSCCKHRETGRDRHVQVRVSVIKTSKYDFHKEECVLHA